ncbi:MAG: helix-turn-helix domain-containing protein [Rhodoferax sp.]|nr:helix-turn-helix domain-containing protein [Rhodoferax sp.]MCB2027645.1 helix-turn-helix domain-containing protein [Rhodoferax sp.]MCW5641438.1 helix-turn-helix domain-containing protein [Rhodoferax sp.]
MLSQQLLTVEDLAKRLNCSPNTVKKNLRQNPSAVPPRLVLPHPRLLRWRLSEVDDWLAGNGHVTLICAGTA